MNDKNIAILLFFLFNIFGSIMGMDLPVNISSSRIPIEERNIQSILFSEKKWWYCDKKFEHGNESSVESVSWHSSGELFIATYIASSSLKTNICEALTGKVILSLDDELNGRSVTWHPKKKWLAIGGRNDKSTQILALEEKQLQKKHRSLSSLRAAVGWRPQKKIWSQDWSNQSIEILNVMTGETISILENSNHTCSAAWHPSGELLAIRWSTRDLGYLKICDMITGKTIRTFEHSGSLVSAAWDLTGEFLAAHWSDGNTGRTLVFDETAATIQKSFDHASNILSATWSTPGYYLAIIFQNGMLAVISTHTGQIKNFKIASGVRSLSWGPDENMLTIGLYNGEIKIIDVIDEKVKSWFSYHETIRSVAWHPQRKCLVVAVGNAARLLKNYTDYKLDQKILKSLFLGWLLIEKPHKGINVIPLLLSDIALKFGMDAQYIFDTWNSFIKPMRDAIWRTMRYRIEIHGK